MTAEKIPILPLRKVAGATSDGSFNPSSLSEDAEKPLKRTRTSTPKSHGGCLTCKIRRVKCDEAKPSCGRCTSTGRKCDGYAIKPRKKRTRPESRDGAHKATPAVSVRVCKSLPLYTDNSTAEIRSLHFYHSKTAPAMSSYFDSDFWLRMLFQLSHVEPSVRHAMVALGALHERRVKDLRSVSETPVVVKTLPNIDGMPLQRQDSFHDEFVLIQYGKAITHLSSRMSSESSIEVTLIACVLFVCVEFLRGDARQAVNHFRSGMKIAMSSGAQGGTITSKAATMNQAKDLIWPFLSRIELYSLIEGQILPEEFARQAALLRQIHVWARAFDEMLLTGTVTDSEMDAVKMIRMNQVILTMWLKRCTSPEESAADASMPEYEIAVSLAESMSGIIDDTRSTEFTISFDMQILTPLFYIASTCRHPQIRRRAVALLKRTQRYECLWDSARAVAVAERIIYYEEQNLTTLDGSELPAEGDRIHAIMMDWEHGANPKVHSVTFRSLPQGLTGPWKSWREQIHLP